MATEPAPQMQEAIRLWSGVQCPNAAAQRSLEDFPALMAEFEAYVPGASAQFKA